MNEEEQKLYDVVADWWDEVFVRPQNPKTIRNDRIIDLVHDIMDLKYPKPKQHPVEGFE